MKSKVFIWCDLERDYHISEASILSARGSYISLKHLRNSTLVSGLKKVHTDFNSIRSAVNQLVWLLKGNQNLDFILVNPSGPASFHVELGKELEKNDICNKVWYLERIPNNQIKIIKV